MTNVTINLTDYITCFSVFEPDYDILNSMSTKPLDKAKNAYNHTKKFTNILNKNEKQFKELDVIAAILSDMNAYFAEALAVQTTLKIDPELGNKFSSNHSLAKISIRNIDDFLNRINETVKAMEQAQSQKVCKDLPLDAVDKKLLTSASIEAPAEKRAFGGNEYTSVKTERSVASLYANGDLNLESINFSNEEKLILKTLKLFYSTVLCNEKKLGLKLI